MPSLDQLSAGGGDLPVVLSGTGKVEIGDSGQQASVEVGVAHLKVDQAASKLSAAADLST